MLVVVTTLLALVLYYCGTDKYLITNSNQRLGSAFYRICSVIMAKWVV